MTSTLPTLVAGLLAAFLMEPWAAFLHGRVWHGFLWGIHRSHHRRRRGRFETNDLLSALHAPVAVALMAFGTWGPSGLLTDAAFGFGAGMTAFGAAYLLVHDGLVHGRLPVGLLARIPWLARVRDAHLVHHRRNGVPFGLFLGPLALRREAHRALPVRPSEPPSRGRAFRARPGRPVGDAARPRA